MAARSASGAWMKKSAVRAAVEAAAESGARRVCSRVGNMRTFCTFLLLVLTTTLCRLNPAPCRMPSGSRRARLV